ncbi:MAG: hypothetical protein CMJ78_25545 [Planctomycetaceae bacterium]|nr:hypothetical protein [Planctomycetaceae bacterium]
MLTGKTIDWKGVNSDGKPVTSADFAGKVVLVDFWASWCIPCIRELPNVKAMYSAYHDRRFEVIGINIDRTSSLCCESRIDDRQSWILMLPSEYYGSIDTPVHS